jgi:hypothetical protein
VLPSIVRIESPYVLIVSWYVPESNWNMTSPPCIAEHGPSAAPAMIGPPLHDGDAGPMHAYVASLWQWARFVSLIATPARSVAL